MVEALFDPASLPDLMTELTVSDEARKRGVTIQVVQRPGGGIVRGIATSSVEQLPRGATVFERAPPVQGADQSDAARPAPAAAHGGDREPAIQRDRRDRDQGDRRDVPDPRRRQRRDRRRIWHRHHRGVGGDRAPDQQGNHPVNIFVPYPPPSEIWPPSLDKDYSIADALKQDGYS